MNTTALWHLTWKEYRAVRPFWLSMVGLILLLQAMIGFFSTEPNWTLLALCNLALAGPAFFAVGAAGTAFAIEHEDGTYDFLRSVPVSSREVFVSKVGLAVAATLAMLLVLVPLTLIWTGLKLPVKVAPSELAGLWIMASLEAIAWGTLFSLLLKRPLPAVCLALVATSTAAHTLAGLEYEGRVIEFQLSAYTAALGWRMALATVVLAVDVALGLRWLRTTGDAAVRPLIGVRISETEAATKISATSREQAQQLIVQPDRFTMINRLLWQHVRQSWRMMLLLAGLQFFLSHVAFLMGRTNGSQAYGLVPLVGFAALMGSSTFLADQERRNFRFFVEHNVPARYVWFTRNFVWIGLLLVTTTLICLAWSVPAGERIVAILAERDRWYGDIDYPPIAFAWAGVAMAFAVGQWSSMFIRSGLLAGFVGLVLTGVLCSWGYLIELYGESWRLFILPIPLVLIAATWLRAPDWILEKTTARARLWASGAVLAPAACLMVLLPVSRVREVSQNAVPFDVASYEAEVTPAGRETAALYRQANELLVGYPRNPEPQTQEEVLAAPRPKALTITRALDAQWLAENEETLRLLLEASHRPDCFLFDFKQNPDPTPLSHYQTLVMLLGTSGRQLEREGKLDAALDRYFDVLRCASHWAQHAPMSSWQHWPPYFAASAFSQISAWSGREGQTPERIAGAIERLSAMDASVLHLEDGIKSDYVLGQLLLKDPMATSWRLGSREQFAPGTMMALRFMPWEFQRERLILNEVTAGGLFQLKQASENLKIGVGLVANDAYQPLYKDRPRFPLNLAVDVRDNNRDAIRTLGDFETDRRATILVLAVQQYRLVHGKLPDTLNDLVGGILTKLPVDPYSGISFRYLSGSTATNPTEKSELESVSPNSPIIWGTGPKLRAEPYSASVIANPTLFTFPLSAVEGYSRYVGNGRRHRSEWEHTPYYIAEGRIYRIPEMKARGSAPPAPPASDGVPAETVEELFQ